MHRVEFEQMGGGLHRPGRFVDMHELDIRAVPSGAQRQPAHATETVDADPDSHFSFLHLVSGARLDAQRARSFERHRRPCLTNNSILLEI
jgi:hypothetical protein